MERTVRYGVGEQSFESLRSEGFLYVDKTHYIEKIIQGSKYYFLGRPRRFGKSLFLSTIKCFFLGKRNLFKGLYVDNIDWNWEAHPVLHLDLNIEKYQRHEDLKDVLESLLQEWEEKYGAVSTSGNISVRFREIIKAAFQKTGKKVVILVDEYDKPLVSNLHSQEMFEFYRNELASLYSNFKSSAEYIQLVFLTGVSRFAHLTVFSGLNNIDDISFDEKYSGVCGISEKELIDNFKTGIASMAEKYNKSPEEIRNKLKQWYDGYRFSGHGEEIYNPYSIVNAMNKEEFRNYWIQTGQASILKDQLKHFNVDLESLFNSVCDLDELQGLDLENPRPVALLYQTGYLTIKKYENYLFTLGIPNREVKQGLLLYLLPTYTNLHNLNARFVVQRFVNDLNSGDIESFMEKLASLFAAVPYDMEMQKEQNIHNALLILMMLLGIDVKTEYRTSNGRIDLFIKTEKYYYIIEIKLDKSSREAIEQINRKDYVLPFATDGRKIFKVGVNFSSKTRTLSDWMIL